MLHEQPGTLDPHLSQGRKRAPGLTSQEVSFPAGCLNHNPSVSRSNPRSKRGGPGRGQPVRGRFLSPSTQHWNDGGSFVERFQSRPKFLRRYQPLVEIDNYGERLLGCVECNCWSRRGSKQLIELPEADVEALKAGKKEKVC